MSSNHLHIDGLAAALRVFHLEGDAVGLGQSEESMVRNARTVEKDIPPVRWTR